jgi:hypothetical protein
VGGTYRINSEDRSSFLGGEGREGGLRQELFFLGWGRRGLTGLILKTGALFFRGPYRINSEDMSSFLLRGGALQD